jgi:enamine deaminase RidA (YjgF/YER057c/UK114 family)
MSESNARQPAMTAIVPVDQRHYYDDWRMSPGLECNGFVFFTGFTGVAPDGELSSDPEQQFRQAFSQVASVLEEGGMDFAHVVEMTTYHVGLRDHLDLFKAIRAEYVREPYPAWTAIEVAGFASEGTIVEIRVIARRP